jgi:dipeptidyl aminopeptidase/acylaminoacyl peptidase
VKPAAGGTAVQLTSDPAVDDAPHWSPDGSTIVFESDRDGNSDIWVMPAAGGAATKLSDDGGTDIQPSWAPDGSSVVFVRGQDIWTATYPGSVAAVARAARETRAIAIEVAVETETEEEATTIAAAPPVIAATGPTVYSFATGAPNPFRHQTKFEFALPQAGRTELVIYDVTGRRVKTLLSRTMEAGRFDATWDGRDEGGRITAPGVYFVRMQSGKFSEVKKAIRLD